MRNLVTLYIGTDRASWCQSLIDRGVWANISEIINYSMRLYLESIQKDGLKAVLPLSRCKTCKVNVRVDGYVMNSLLETGFFDRTTLADYAINNYMLWRNEFDPEGP